jgi:pimeloyl-ACP methyl ester carboxylesterase
VSTASVGGITVGYDDAGGGDPLLLIHGHPFDRSMWRPQLDRFAGAGHRVIVPDLRGYGASAGAAGRTGLDVFAGDLAALLDHLGVRRAVVGGLSMGGQIAMEFLRLFPERVRALLLADTTAAPETPEGRAGRAAMADRLEREGMAGYAEEALPSMVSARTLRERPEVGRHVLAMMRGAPPEGAAAALRGRAERPDYAPVLAGAAVPALVVVGGDDAFTPVADARAIQALLPGAELVVVEGAGHLPNLERPEEFDAALSAFLDRLPAATPEGAR